MNIIELKSRVDDLGQLIIPAPLLSDMGLRVGATVTLTYASSSGELDNTYCQFVLSPAGIRLVPGGQQGEAELTLPMELLAAAEIPPGSSLDVLGARGVIVLMASDVLHSLPDELMDLFAELGIDVEIVRQVMQEGESSQ